MRKEYGVLVQSLSTRHNSNKRGIQAGLVFLTATVLYFCWTRYPQSFWEFESKSSLLESTISKVIMTKYSRTCPQTGFIEPKENRVLWGGLEEIYASKEFQKIAYDNLGGAVRIRTETFDDVGPIGEDPHWEKFTPFHDYLQEAFPLVHRNLKKTTVNKVGLAYHWQGSQASLKPILLAAHQDVVPVPPESESDWVEPPWSGKFDGEWIWGRGSCDDKAGLVSLLTSIEMLLKQGFQPTRTVVLAFGADEERGGKDTGSALGKHLLETYGADSFAIIVDEGGSFSNSEGAVLALPAVAEKGKIDLRVDITSSGGHSSVPPRHTAIGMLASALVAIEDNPFLSTLQRSSVYYQQLICEALHKPTVDPKLRDLVLRSMEGDDYQDGSDADSALREIEDYLLYSNRFRAQTGTTIATDLVGGGIKSNALPEEAWAVINHRISDLGSVKEVQDHWTSILEPIARKFNLTFNPFTSPSTKTSKRTLSLSDAYGTALEPSPISPTFGDPVWELFASTIRSSITHSPRMQAKHEGKNGLTPIIVSPSLSLGNTDTRHYWNLTRSIFRYGHRAKEDTFYRTHTINEAIRGEGFLDMIRFHTHLILNFDEASEIA